MKGLFTPAIKLMNRMRYAQKFTLIGVLVFLVIGWLGLQVYHELDEHLERARKEHHGLEYIKEVRQIIKLTQQHRGAVAGFLGG
ncbi:MAG: methyl-accepting chemotaxis protein, partial [Nitrospirota bacterium]|nr:methyl-accepting chemotaxis protein [Nitrospirota bacterium]